MIDSDLLESYMPTEAPVLQLNDVDLGRWIDEGVQALILDWEDTVGEAGATEGRPDIIEYLERYRGERGIQFTAITTNKMPKSNEDRRLLEGWGEQISADLVIHPLHGSERKPSPVMGLKAMEFAEAEAGIPKDGAMWGLIGDKATSDVRAANFAGIEHIAWTRPFGGSARHPGDRFVRDPFEQVIRVAAHLKLNPVLQPEEDKKYDEKLTIIKNELELPEDFPNRIVGDGIADIQLSAESLALIRTPAYRKAINGLVDLYNEHSHVPREKLREFLFENGRTAADALVWGRLASSLAIAGLHFCDMDDDTRLKVQTSIAIIANLSDVADGKAARAHKDGATKEGGEHDQRIDKILSASEDIFMLLPRGLITKTDVLIPVMRDAALTLLRKPFAERGIDTKSIRSGKRAMLLLAGSQLVSATMGESYPVFAKRLRMAANLGKVASALQAPFAWIDQHERKMHDLKHGHRAS